MDWKDLMEGLGRGAFQRHPNESDHKFRERIMKMGTTVLTPPGALTQGELEREIGWAVNQFAGTKVTPHGFGMSDHFTWEIPLPVEEKKETVSLVREDAPWFWGR